VHRWDGKTGEALERLGSMPLDHRTNYDMHAVSSNGVQLLTDGGRLSTNTDGIRRGTSQPREAALHTVERMAARGGDRHPYKKKQ
jgi:hypothetical protein